MRSITKAVRNLRRAQTPSEKRLWNLLRDRKFLGLKFKKQQPIFFQNSQPGRNSYFVADFYCHEYKLVIELDGEVHYDQCIEDQNRDEILSELGFTVLRFMNSELNDQQSFLSKLEHRIELLNPSPEEERD